MEDSRYFKEFASDILRLYAKTGVKEIESFFIVLSQAYGDDFQRWLSKNVSIKSRLGNPEIYNTLLYLFNLRKSYPSGLSYSNAAALFTGSKDAMYLPLLNAFSKLDMSGGAGEILSPFQNIISTFKSFDLSSGQTDLGGIRNDLEKIANEFNSRSSSYEDEFPEGKQTIRQERLIMFKYLFKRFSNEIATAFESKGMIEPARKIRGGALIKDVSELIGSMEGIDPVSMVNISAIDSLLSATWKNHDSQWSNYNHDNIETTLLSQAGEISIEELYSMRDKYLKGRDVIGEMEEESLPHSSIDTKGIVTNDKRTNPKYIAMLFWFFRRYGDKIGGVK